MTTCNEIQELLEKSELENLRYELKSSKILKEDDWKDKLAKEFVGFANRIGGKVIIGLQNDGTFDGEADYEIDNLKGDIDNIIHNKISPIMNCNFEFLKCEKGDLSIITIEKKNEIPFAFIIERKGPEIKNRIYYIRTPHGTRLVSDRQLHYLFNEKELNIIHPFSVAIVFKRPEFLIPAEFDLAPQVKFDFAILFNKYYPKYKELEDQISGKFDQFIIQLILYQLIYTILRNFQLTWDIYFIESTDTVLANRETPKELYEINNLPEPHKDSVLSKLSLSLNDIFEDIFIKKVYLPPKTKIEIDQNGRLKMYNDVYSFNIFFSSFSGGQGFAGNHPQAGKYSSVPWDSDDYQGIFEKYTSIKIKFFFEGNLKFPEPELEYFESYIKFMNTVKDLIDRNWNHDEFIKTLPNYMFFNLEERLNRIEKLLKKKRFLKFKRTKISTD